MGASSSKSVVIDDDRQQVMSEKQLSHTFTALNLDDNEARIRFAGLSQENLARYDDEFHAEPKNLFAQNAITRNEITSVLVNHKASVKDQHIFNVQTDVEGKATNQKSSGRCWLFAGTNVLRRLLIQKYKLEEDFELSQSYLFFYDKLEKANYFLENMIDLADKDIDDRVVQYLLQAPVNDGGQWDMFINVVEKYGIVPKSAFPETFSSSSSSRLNWLATVKLREFAVEIRKAHEQGISASAIRAQKDRMVAEIHRILMITLGQPPKKFDWEIKNKDGKLIHIKNLTPTKFYKDIIDYKLTDTVSLINDPRNDYSKLYTVDRLGNVVGGLDIRYLNTSAKNLKKLAIAVLKSNRPVWFGCDVGQFSNRDIAAMDTDLFNYELAFNVKLGLTKAQRVLYGESLMTHAMVFSGVHLDEDGHPVRWRVENSWGNDSGDKGYWIMSDKWFEQFVYQVVLEKKDVPHKLLSLLDTDPTVLPAYDPMGALA
ncbi:bleomycin hydrolase [Umbelopsis sp. WA50703]